MQDVFPKQCDTVAGKIAGHKDLERQCHGLTSGEVTSHAPFNFLRRLAGHTLRNDDPPSGTQQHVDFDPEKAMLFGPDKFRSAIWACVCCTASRFLAKPPESVVVDMVPDGLPHVRITSHDPVVNSAKRRGANVVFIRDMLLVRRHILDCRNRSVEFLRDNLALQTHPRAAMTRSAGGTQMAKQREDRIGAEYSGDIRSCLAPTNSNPMKYQSQHALECLI
jgi:hypothetical protein